MNAKNVIKQRIVWSPNFIREFGLVNGISLLFRIVKDLPRTSSTIHRYRIPGYVEDVFLRDTVADHATFKQCLVSNQYDFLNLPQAERLNHAYRSTLESGRQPLIIDGGANIGLATLWFARHFPEALIVAIEPDEDNFEILQKNTQHLGTRVSLIKGGLWPRSARLCITNPDAGAAAFRVAELPEGSSGGVMAYSIDDICSRASNPCPLIVKLDIEGAQAHLFSDNTAWVSRADLITLELDDWLLPWQGTSRNFFRCLSQYPFDYLINKESIFCFRDSTPASIESLDQSHQPIQAS